MKQYRSAICLFIAAILIAGCGILGGINSGIANVAVGDLLDK